MSKLGLFGAGCLALSLHNSCALAKGPFDGAWRVTLQVSSGPCLPPVYIYHAVIVGGRLRPAPSSGSRTVVNGSVTSAGRVRAEASRGTDTASGAGQLAGNSGSGNWNSETRKCSGTWTATRE